MDTKKIKRIIAREGLIVVFIIGCGLILYAITKSHIRVGWWHYEYLVRQLRYLTQDVFYSSHGIGIKHPELFIKTLIYVFLYLGYPIYALIRFILWALRKLSKEKITSFIFPFYLFLRSSIKKIGLLKLRTHIKIPRMVNKKAVLIILVISIIFSLIVGAVVFYLYQIKRQVDTQQMQLQLKEERYEADLRRQEDERKVTRAEEQRQRQEDIDRQEQYQQQLAEQAKAAIKLQALQILTQQQEAQAARNQAFYQGLQRNNQESYNESRQRIEEGLDNMKNIFHHKRSSTNCRSNGFGGIVCDTTEN